MQFSGGVPLGQRTAAQSIPVVLASDVGATTNLTQVGGQPIALGQATRAASLPVTLANDQPAIGVNLSTVGGGAIALGQATMAASLPVVIASNQGAVSVTGAQTPGDAVANPADAVDSRDFLEAWDGATWRRVVNALFVTGSNVGGTGAMLASQIADATNGKWVSLRSIGEFTGTLGVVPAMQPSSDNPPAAGVSAANAAVSIVFAAVAGLTHRLTWLVVSYATAPTTGRMTVSDGTNNILDVDITATGPISIPLPPGGLLGRVGAAMTITLAAGGAAVVGKVSAAKLTG